MEKSLIMLAMIVSAFFCSSKVKAQWQSTNSLSDLNTWSAEPGFIGWYNTAGNGPAGQAYGAGIQTVLPVDVRFGSQIVIPTFDNQIYYRRYIAGNWDPWYKVWSSANLNKADVDFTTQTVNCTNVYANGNIWAKTIKVEMTNPWPDYVFKSDYHLPSLTDVKSYIDKNHHLPEMPSEAEVENNNINLGEVIKVQTKKIEELTLYLINLGELVKLQTKKIEELTLYLIEKDEQLKREAELNEKQQKDIEQLKKQFQKFKNIR